MTITITKAGVAAWLLAVVTAVLSVSVYFQDVQNDLQSDHIASLKKANAELTTERDALASEVARLKKLGSAQGAPMGRAAISNEEVVQIYAENEAEISALWVSMGGETTLGQAVVEWLKTHPLPQKVKP